MRARPVRRSRPLQRLLLAVLLAPWAALADLDASTVLIPFQARITDSSAAPISGSVDLTLAIYDAETGGSALWSERHASVPLDDGRLQIILGHSRALVDPEDDPIDFRSPKYIGITVGGSAQEMVPRHRLVPAAHARRTARADRASQLGGLGAASYAEAAIEADESGAAHARVAEIGSQLDLIQAQIDEANGSRPSFLWQGTNNGRVVTDLQSGSAWLVPYDGDDLLVEVGGELHTHAGPLEFVLSADVGLDYETFAGTWTNLPDFDAETPVASGVTTDISVAPVAGQESVGLRFRGFLEIRDAANYTFHLRSDDGSRLLIDGATVVDNDGLHSASTATATVSLSAGEHPIEIQYFNGPTDSLLELTWESSVFPVEPGFSARRTIAPGLLSRTAGGSTHLAAGEIRDPDTFYYLYLRTDGAGGLEPLISALPPVASTLAHPSSSGGGPPTRYVGEVYLNPEGLIALADHNPLTGEYRLQDEGLPPIELADLGLDYSGSVQLDTTNLVGRVPETATASLLRVRYRSSDVAFYIAHSGFYPGNVDFGADGDGNLAVVPSPGMRFDARTRGNLDEATSNEIFWLPLAGSAPEFSYAFTKVAPNAVATLLEVAPVGWRSLR